MIKRTEKDITDFILSMYTGLSEYRTPEISFSKPYGDYKYIIKIASMYEAVPLGLKHLMKLSEFFGTTNIDNHPFANSGCETCDYGSSYGHTLYVKEEE